MNTIKSVWYGWGVLIGAGAFSYFLAKRSIAADRVARHGADVEAARQQRLLRENEEKYRSYLNARNVGGSVSGGGTAGTAQAGNAGRVLGDEDGGSGGSPAREAQTDPAATRHAPVTREQEGREKSKYEASEPWVSPKGNRFT